MRKVVVVGGGLAGLAISGLLSKSGFTVTALEARGMAAQNGDAFRSINLALSLRGIRAFDALGITHEVMRSAAPMGGRRIHLSDGREDFQSYDLVGNEAIYSIRRSSVWQLLRGAAETAGVNINFGTRCIDVDFDMRSAAIVDPAGQASWLTYDALIGADGAHSAVRRALVDSGHAVEETRILRHGYLELFVPKEGAARLDRHALHIWPRGDQMLIALPNADGSFTATLFLPLDDEWDRHPARMREAALPAFRQEFPDAVALIPDLAAALAENPLGRLTSTASRPWTDGKAVLLIGDAAHTMAPFYGQGMNCALEDCCVLAHGAERFMGDWPKIFTDFERRRRPDADAITLLSEMNYKEMSHHVAERDFKLRREIERALQTRFPGTFTPLYAMIAFSALPYAEALARDAIQARIVDRLAAGIDRVTQLNLETKWLRTALDSLANRRV